MSLNVDLLEKSFQLVAPEADELADRFYERLFANNPRLRPMFPDNMDEQKGKLIAALALVVNNLRRPNALTEAVGQLGIRHISYGVTRDMYPIVGENLLAVLEEFAGDVWDDKLQQAWADAYTALTEIIFTALDDFETRKVA